MRFTLPRFLQNMLARDVARDRRRHARVELACLDERLLRDIGVTEACRDDSAA
jgi:uncharacterized protein YjiS (DUF1127 family)